MFSKKLIKYAAATTVAINCAYQPFGDVNNQFCTKHTVCDSDTKLDTKQRKQIKDEIRKLSLKKSIPDQPKRFKKAKDTQNERYLNIDAVYDANYVRGKYVLITGGNRGIGLELAKEMKSKGAHVIVTTRSKTIPDNLIELMKVNKKQSKDGSGGATGTLRCLTGIDVTDNNVSDTLITQLKTIKDLTYIDIVVNNAGYFYEPHESILENTLNMNEELSMIDICALGPLRITNALIHGKYLCTTNDLPTSNEDASINVNGEVDRNTQHPSKIVFITSQGGSIAWRFTQNPKGGDYGHHMSKAAANMMGVLVSQELKGLGISVGILHPGFNKTDMTAKYASIWEIEGAVDASVGAKRVVHEIGQLDTHLHAINTVRDMRLQLRHSGIDESSNTTVTEADHNRDTSVCEGGAEMLPIDTYVLDIYHADMVANDDGGYSTAWKHWYIYHSIDGYPYYYNTKTHEWFWMYPPVYHKKRTVIKVADEEDKNVSESINSSIPTTMTKTVDTVNDNNGVFIPNEDTHKNCVFINCEDGKVIPW